MGWKYPPLYRKKDKKYYNDGIFHQFIKEDGIDKKVFNNRCGLNI